MDNGSNTSPFSLEKREKKKEENYEKEEARVKSVLKNIFVRDFFFFF